MPTLPIITKDFIDASGKPFGVPSGPAPEKLKTTLDPVFNGFQRPKWVPNVLYYPEDLPHRGSASLRSYLRFDVVDYESAKLETRRHAFSKLNDDISLNTLAAAAVGGGVGALVGQLAAGSGAASLGAKAGIITGAIFQSSGVDIKKVGTAIINGTPSERQDAKQEAQKLLNKGVLADVIKTVETGLKDRGVSEPFITICLPEPDSLEYGYSTKYADTDLTSTQRAIDVTKSILGSGKNNSVVSNTIKEMGISNVNDILKRMGEGVGFGDIQTEKLVRASTRMLPNPTLEYLFEGVNRRGFDFHFKFFPKSRNEVQSVFDIIQVFKKFSLPSHTKVNTGGFYLEFPKLFKITHRYYDRAGKDNENLYLPQMKLCSLENVKVNYTEAGRFSLFDEEIKGMAENPGSPNSPTGRYPVAISLDLSFKETELITANDITSVYDRNAADYTEEGTRNKYH